MSDDKKTPSLEEEGFNLEAAKDMTVGDAVRKDSEIKAGITEDDGVLDKYIKQHRQEVASQKFDSQTAEYENLDTSTLDDFIKKQREELVSNGMISSTETDVVEEEAHSETSTPRFDEVPDLTETTDYTITEEKSNDIPSNEQSADIQEDEMVALGDLTDDQPIYKNKRLIIGGLAALIVVIFGVAYALNFYSKQDSSTTSSSSTTKSSSSSSTSTEAKKNKSAFDELYDSFFTDDNQTALKNSEFDNLTSLEEALDKLKDTDYYDDAKEKYDSLKVSIEAIQAVNTLFESDIIQDGELVSATIKSDADFDSLSSDTLNTGNATLDTLLQSAITEGKSQLEKLKSSTSSSTTTSSSATESSASSSISSDSTTSTMTSSTVSYASGYGITSYDESTLQRSLSRVPYNESAIADTTNSAWTFTDGVLDKIVATANARGYFSGNDYILEKVNIINGNGYYNMFKSDGTYLFSINAKTGYFVGNASGNSDALDY